MDPAEVRRKNFITEFPHQTVTGANYDSGEYLGGAGQVPGQRRLRGAARRADGAARARRRQQLGLGICSYVEWTGFGSELGTCEVDEDGKVTVTAGTSSHGQGHETAYAQIVAGTLGVPLADVKVIQSDTKLVKRGMGTMGSRSLQVGGTAVQQRDRRGAREGQAARRAPARGRQPADIQVVPGQGLGVAGLARLGDPVGAARGRGRSVATPEGFEGGLAAENDFETPDATYPFGTHLAVVEVDTETGLADLVRHITVDDSGRIHNELLLEGQVHGGIAQGVAQALYEEIAFDEDGNNVTGSLASYAIPSSSDLPSFETERTQTPSPRNPLGAKGVGESGRDRLHAGGLERGHRRALAPGRQEHRHARDAAARLEGDQRSRVISSSAAVSASMSRAWCRARCSPGPPRAGRARARRAARRAGGAPRPRGRSAGA